MAKFDTLRDNFNDNSFDVSKWESSDYVNQPTETNNRLEFILGASTQNSGITSVSTFDLLNSYVQFEMYSYDEYFECVIYTTSSSSGIDFWIQSGSLRFIVYEAFVNTHDFSFSYDATAMRWIRVRETSGVIYIETSPNGIAWTVRDTSIYTQTLTGMNVQLYTANPSGAASTSYLDNFNILQGGATLDGVSTINTTSVLTFHLEVTLTGTSAINAYGTIATDQSSTVKSFLYKIYDADDNFLGTWNDVSSEFTYSQEINSAGSSIQVELARNSDTRFIRLDDLITTHTSEVITTFAGDTLVVRAESNNNVGPGSDVDVNYRVEVWVFYGSQESLETTSGELILTDDGQEITLNLGAVNGLRKFNGYITKYVSRYGTTESVLVSIASFGRELDNYVLKSGSNTTVTYSSTAPNTILTAALSNFNSQGGIVSYTTNSIEATGTTVSYTFRLNTFLEVMKKCLELAPYDWYWYVGLGDDTVYFQSRSDTPSHYFTLGEHIESLELEYYIEDITNLVYFTGAETAGVSLFEVYTDATSITNYRQGLKRISDHRVSVTASADLIAEGEIDRNDTPRYRSSVTILSDVYPTEEIMLGQSIGFNNFGNYVDDVVLQVVGIDYEPDRVTLQLDTLLPRVNKRIEDLTRNMIELDNQNIPTAP